MAAFMATYTVCSLALQMQSGLQPPALSLQTRSWHFTHAHTSSGCSPQIGSQTGHLARQLAALFVHAPHAVDKRREHTSRIWCSCFQKLNPDPAAFSLRCSCHTATVLCSITEASQYSSLLNPDIKMEKNICQGCWIFNFVKENVWF